MSKKADTMKKADLVPKTDARPETASGKKGKEETAVKADPKKVLKKTTDEVSSMISILSCLFIIHRPNQHLKPRKWTTKSLRKLIADQRASQKKTKRGYAICFCFSKYSHAFRWQKARRKIKATKRIQKSRAVPRKEKKRLKTQKA